MGTFSLPVRWETSLLIAWGYSGYHLTLQLLLKSSRSSHQRHGCQVRDELKFRNSYFGLYSESLTSSFAENLLTNSIGIILKLLCRLMTFLLVLRR